MVANCVDTCLVLAGPSGCGKTALVHALSELQHQELMVVHLGEQIDSKVICFSSNTILG